MLTQCLKWRKWLVGSLAGLGAATASWTVVAVMTAPPAWAGTVTVQPGQDLTQIAAELGTTVAALVAANGLDDPNHVLAGELLQVPISGGGDASSTTSVVVQPGQDLTQIAARYGVSVSQLAAANGLENPNQLLAGAVLQVPGSGAASPGAGTTSVVVQPGQTLTAIATQYAVSVSALAALNGLQNPNYILAGTTLLIPQSATALADYSTPADNTVAAGGLPSQLAANPGRLTLEPDFAAAAATYGVPLPLLEALCWWESGWQAAVVSPTGALGVCQIEPATADFVDEYLADSDLDPQVASQNIDIGAAYLASLLVHTGGNVSEAVAGYYQGLASVEQHGMTTATADYVQGIEAYAAIFSR